MLHSGLSSESVKSVTKNHPDLVSKFPFLYCSMSSDFSLLSFLTINQYLWFQMYQSIMAYIHYGLQLPVMLYWLQKHYKMVFYLVPILQQINYEPITKPIFFHDTLFLHQFQLPVIDYLQPKLPLMRLFHHLSVHKGQY